MEHEHTMLCNLLITQNGGTSIRRHALVNIILCFVILLHHPNSVDGALGAYAPVEFISEADHSQFANFVVDESTGDIYIGAKNSLFHLHSDFSLQEVVSTAPDLAECKDPGSCVNYNRILAIAPSPIEKLITCGNFSRKCQYRELVNISNSVEYPRIVINAKTPAVAVLHDDYMYVGVSPEFPAPSNSPSYVTQLHLDSLSLREKVSNQNVRASQAQFALNFVNGFEFEGFTYFVTNQQQLIGEDPPQDFDYISKINRVCQEGNSFYSFTEVQLTCSLGNGRTYNLIQAIELSIPGKDLGESFNSSKDPLLHAVFAESSEYTDEAADPAHSVLCIYKMSELLAKFKTAVEDCTSKGDVEVHGIRHLQSRCNNIALQDIDLCNVVWHRYARGTEPLQAEALIPFDNVLTTSIRTVTGENKTVALIGTSTGNLLKVHISNATHARMYEDVKVGDTRVQQDTYFNATDDHLYLLTEQKLVRLSVVNCSQYTTCEECIGNNGGQDGDPYCGWCTLEARCTRYEACPLHDESTRWLPYNALQCVSISGVQPNRLPYHQTQQEINIIVQQLPDLRSSFQYMCAFNSYKVSATTTGNIVTCTPPPANGMPTIPDGLYFLNLPLSVVSTETNVKFVTTDFFFFDCSHIKSCSSCVTNPFPCNWCVYDNQCTDDSSSCQTGDTVVIGENNTDGSGNKGPGFCPQLLGTTESFLIPVNIPFGYSLSAKNLPIDQSKGLLSYECILDIDGEEVRVPSTTFNETYVLCNDEQYTYTENIIQKIVSVSVQWEQNRIDYLSEPYVILYKCSVNSGSCSQCLSQEVTPSILKCGWCGDDCNVIQSDICQSNQFLNQNETQKCSAPVITDFDPLSVTTNGRTRLEIHGTDIGVVFDDILQIRIQDLECDLTDMGEYYQPGQSVSCTTDISHEVISGRIEITVASGNGIKKGRSTTKFQYRDPMITGFNPREGPVAGGTEITINGMNLDTGRIIAARFRDADCVEISVQDTIATCITSSIRGNEQVTVHLAMTFDGEERQFSDYAFNYMPNPRIDNIDRTSAIMSGGLDISLTGVRFDLIQEPRIVVTSLTTNATNSELCNGTETILTCPTPSFPDADISARRRRTTDGAMIAKLTYDFDGYVIDGGTIDYFPDPVYESFSGNSRIYESDNKRLEITGMDLTLASTEDDVLVLLGPDGQCYVDGLNINVLRCQLPDDQPQAGYLNGTLGQGDAKNLPAVTVVHGNLRFYPGFVSAWSATGDSPVSAIIISSVVGLIVIITLIIILVWWSRKEQRHLQRAREEVEMVRSDFIKRVREVGNTSLDVTEADDRTQKHGVPFRGHVHCLTMMLFKGLGVHPETTDPEYMEDFMEHSVISFYRMLKKKEVFIDFIRQLERKKEGRGREREIIASLLAITFVSEGKSIHFTDVVMSLVEDEVRMASESSREMDTLFTNTETIAGKLVSSWFTLFMFTYLKVYAFYPLYMLYQAIKTQAEKGPIDEGTGEAYYTLEYNKLFDQTVEFHSLGLDVVDEDGKVYLHVNVLDVDSVKQVKKKVLDCAWRRGYCLQPRDVDAVDLVLVQTHKQSILLHETSETQGKVTANTMNTYKIQNGYRVALIPMQHGEGDGYQALDLKEVASDTYASSTYVTDGDVLDSLLPQQGSKIIHLKDLEQSKMKTSSLPIHIHQKSADLDRNLVFPQMLTMKASISPYVDGILEVMFKMPAKVPLPIKHLFDTFDELAVKYGEAHAEDWKKNCLSNFWLSVLTNLPSLLEMPRSETADRCVDILADALKHATRTISLRQGESDHLPYYNEHPLQRKMVTDYCNEIANQPKLRPIKLNRACSNISKEFKDQFSHLSNMMHLYNLTKSDVENLFK